MERTNGWMLVEAKRDSTATEIGAKSCRTHLRSASACSRTRIRHAWIAIHLPNRAKSPSRFGLFGLITYC